MNSSKQLYVAPPEAPLPSSVAAVKSAPKEQLEKRGLAARKTVNTSQSMHVHEEVLPAGAAGISGTSKGLAGRASSAPTSSSSKKSAAAESNASLKLKVVGTEKENMIAGSEWGMCVQFFYFFSGVVKVVWNVWLFSLCWS